MLREDSLTFSEVCKVPRSPQAQKKIVYLDLDKRSSRITNCLHNPMVIIRVPRFFGSAIVTATFWALLLSQLCSARTLKEQSATTNNATVSYSDFHGSKAIVVRNRAAEVVIVPEIGRVMEFNLLDGTGRTRSGPFWKNPALDKSMQADGEGWKNYGGDKAWPSPQSDWPKIAGRGWPPPAGFDAVPFSDTLKHGQVQLVSPVDANYGVRIRRTISLDSQKSVLSIKTTYEKVRGEPIRISVWTITQLAAPDRAFILLPPQSQFPSGYTNLIAPGTRDAKVDGRLLSLGRDPVNRVKIGSDGDALLWVGNGPDLLLQSQTSNPDGAAAEWPEQGSHAQIYTSPGDEMKYVEFELLSRLVSLSPGQHASLDVVYTLIPRTLPDSTAEARKVLQLQ